MSATQRVEVLSVDGDAAVLRIYIIHPDEGDLYPDKTIALQWLIGGLPDDHWRAMSGPKPLLPLEDCAPLAQALREAGVVSLSPVTWLDNLAWWLLINERRVVDIDWLADRNVEPPWHQTDGWQLDLSKPETLPQADVLVRVGTPGLLAHLSPGQTWEGAPFSIHLTQPKAPPPAPVASEAPPKAASPRRERPDVPALLAAHDGETLSIGWGVRWSEGDAERLAQWPGLAAVRSLTLRKPLGEVGLTALAGSPHAAGIERLALENPGLTEQTLKALADAPGWGSLIELHVVEDPAGEAVLILPETALWSRLTSLGLCAVNLTAPHALALLRSPPPNLHTLDLSSNDMEDPEVLLAIAALPRLTALNLSGSFFQEADAVEMLARKTLPLEALDVTGNDFSGVGLAALHASHHWPTLRRLDLTNTALTDADFSNLMSGPHAEKLTHLRLYNLPLGLATFTKLLDAPTFPALRELTFGENAFDKRDVADLTTHITLTHQR